MKGTSTPTQNQPSIIWNLSLEMTLSFVEEYIKCKEVEMGAYGNRLIKRVLGESKKINGD